MKGWDRKISRVAKIKDMIMNENPEAIFLDGFEEALIGCICNASHSAVAAYDTTKILNILMEQHHMPPPEAVVYFDKKIHSRSIGPHAPLFLSQPAKVPWKTPWE